MYLNFKYKLVSLLGEKLQEAYHAAQAPVTTGWVLHRSSQSAGMGQGPGSCILSNSLGDSYVPQSLRTPEIKDRTKGIHKERQKYYGTSEIYYFTF